MNHKHLIVIAVLLGLAYFAYKKGIIGNALPAPVTE